MIMERWKGRVYGILGIFKTLQQYAGLSSGLFGASGNLYSNGVAVGSSATNALQTLMSTTIPASALDNVGRAIFIKAWGVLGANANNKSVNLVVGGQKIQSGSSTQSGVSWDLEGYLIKNGSNSQQLFLNGFIGTTRVVASAISDTSVDTAAITVAVTAQSGSASQSDVIQNGMEVQFSS